jgi:uncharacterized protein
MAAINPFILGRYVNPDYFCDRDNEKERIINAFKNQRNLTLISHRKYGKSSLIHHVFYELSTSNQGSFFYIDLMHTGKLEDFVIAFAKAVIGQFDSKTTALIKSFTKVVKSIRPMISFDPQNGKPAVEISLQPDSTPEHNLDEIFNYLDIQDTQILIAFDEFQQILNYPEKNVEALLRGRIQQNLNCNFIFSGSEKHLLMQMFNSYSRPFYQSTEMLELGKIDKSNYEKFIQTKFESGKINIGFQEIELILEYTRLHTWYVQYLCNRLFSSGQKTIDSGIINDTAQNILLENEVMYFAYLKLLTEQQIKLLKAIAAESSVKMITSQAFIQKHKLTAASSVKTALTALISKELIYNEGGYYQLYDVFFSHWLEKY